MEISDVIVPATTWLVGMTVAFFFPEKSFLSVLGILVASIGIGLFIPVAFQSYGEFEGWVVVVLSLVYVYLSTRAFVQYCKSNKLDDE